MAVVMTAAEFVASTRCASEVLRVQHRVWPLYQRKHGRSRQRGEPLRTVAQGLAENLTNVAAAAETLGNWSDDSDLAEEAVDQLIEFLEWSEASLLQQRKVIEAFVEGRRADDITKAFKRVLQLFDVAIGTVQEARWSFMIADGIRAPADGRRFVSGAELVAASLDG